MGEAGKGGTSTHILVRCDGEAEKEAKAVMETFWSYANGWDNKEAEGKTVSSGWRDA